MGRTNLSLEEASAAILHKGVMLNRVEYMIMYPGVVVQLSRASERGLTTHSINDFYESWNTACIKLQKDK